MQIKKIPFAKVSQLSTKDLAYVQSDSRLRDFYKYSVAIEEFQKVIADKAKQNTNRKVLTEVLSQQYDKLEATELQIQQIKRLSSDQCFTVTTAHQPGLFTGPLYYIYKIASTINLSRQLAQHYPDYQFVPIFITGGEDHDFEEINHIQLFNQSLRWENDENGSVSAMSTESLQTVLEELEAILGNSPQALDMMSKLRKHYQTNSTYGQATIAFTHDLFRSTELLILDMNTAPLKRLFSPIIKEELLHQVSKPYIEKAANALNDLGFKPQAFPREINLFYLQDQSRERIVFEDNQYKVLNTEVQFTEAELLSELADHPERFSPNVILRPLYQELILPNLAYIGGGGEIAYWLERKAQFEHFGINFPMLIRRNSVLWLDKGAIKKMQKLALTTEDLFYTADELTKAYIHQQSSETLSLDQEISSIKKAYESIAELAKKVDPTLEKAVLAEETRQLKSLGQLEGRLVRAEKKKHEAAINQLTSLKEKLFPKNGLQERHDNLIPFYMKHGSSYIDFLCENLSPLEAGFVIVEED